MKSLIIALTLALSLPAYAYQVIGIADGDTLTLLVDKRPLKIRLANIDAPEKAQSFGERSRQSLSELCFRKDASFTTQNIDRYGRTVAVVTCGTLEANRMQVERGMAWVYTKYNKDAALPPLQETARTERRGLWRDTAPLPPWEFRKQKRGG
jgi:micrococcal nuclease